LARFDAATVVKAKDVSKFDSKYEQISSRFTSFQCQNLIFWAYSRRPNQVKYEDGFNDALNSGQDVLLKKFHPSSQLVNQEMRAKLARMAISLATMLFSTPVDNWECIFVKCEHVVYIVEFLTALYSHPNVAMDEFSNDKWRQAKLGDMEFMKNIMKYVSLDSILSIKEASEKDICCMFSDYLLRVSRSELYIVDGKTNRVSSGYRSHEVNDKFIGLLTARNCIVKTRRNKYKKTEVFCDWLLARKRKGKDAESSDILEVSGPKYDPARGFNPEEFKPDGRDTEHGKNN